MDQMNNAALYNSSWKDGTGSIFKPTDSIHGDEANVLHATGLDFIKDLHPGMLAFRFVDPQAQDIFVAVFVITQNDIDSLLVDGSFGPHENVKCSLRTGKGRMAAEAGSAIHGLHPGCSP